MENIHDNHRERMFDKIKKNGAESFYDYELLEMLLYYCIPRKDTNPIAHGLEKEFGNLANMFKAPRSALCDVDGIGEKSATLIYLVGELARRGLTQERIDKRFKIDNTGDALKYCETLFLDKRYECFYAICLDIGGRVISDGFIAEGVVNQVPAYSRKIVEAAIRHAAHSVVITHNHPGGEAFPSKSDDEVTEQAQKALAAIGINLNDHIIIGNTGSFSYLNSNFLRKDGVSRELDVAQKINMLRNE